MKPDIRRRALRLSVLDGCAYSFMVGGAESYLTAFAVFLGVPAFRIGFLTSVPQLAGSAAQLLTPAGVRLLRGLKAWVVTLAFAQAAVLATIALVPRLGGAPFLPLLALLCGYWTLNLAIGPAWNHWMAILVPARRRAAYFSRRNRVLHVCVLVGLAAGGLILERAKLAGATALGFAAIIAGGGAMRFVSATFLAFQAGPTSAELKRAESFLTFLRRLPGRPEVRLLPFLWAFNFAIAIASPYFTPYMLEELHLSYWTFMAIIGTAFLSKSATMGMWGRAARRLGPRRALLLGALLIIPAPALWSVSGSVPYLVLLQMVVGAAWAGFELCQLLLFYDLVEEDRLSDVFSYYSLVNGIGQLAGAVLGAHLLRHPLLSHRGYLEIFFLSSLVRLISLLTLLGALRGLLLRRVMPRQLVVRVVGLLPDWGTFVHTVGWWRPRTAPRKGRGRAPRPGGPGGDRGS